LGYDDDQGSFTLEPSHVSRFLAILFYANYKMKTQNSAWEPGSSHSAFLNYVKKSRSPLLPQNAP